MIANGGYESEWHGEMTKNVKLSFGLIMVFIAVVAVALAASRGGDDPPAEAVEASDPAVRDGSHRLSTAPAGAPVLVEFLDFECESCGAAYPIVEELREEYDGRVEFVARYFPIPSHFNAERAAVAVEAAAQQGRFEAMYQRMFETQAEWGEQQVAKDDLFRSFAEDLGLDMAAYDAAVADPKTRERVLRDREDGVALGVEGTPTFFLDGEKIEPTSVDQFRALLDAAIED